ncbi:MAG TPA: DUF302 domain-containing protein [Spirochaetota bacterium]|nr:DUF302 domain-containing protein [Spirochaetota bacterium]HPJ36249.1 DUF302 domain-containing protein [Spirochaetota bacterium]
MYYINKQIEMVTFSEIERRVREELKKEGFGIITEINLREKFREKLSLEFRQYKILGACNTPFTYRALMAEDKIGTILPCNIIIQETGNSSIEVAAVDPVASMERIRNEELTGIASEIREMLARVIKRI